ncbi:MAG: RnfH family protein [Pseudomonadota bacterium]|nr:RnfH family protein [Pseudomonadota bacterium]
MKIEVVIGWPRRHRAITLELDVDACVQDAIAAARLEYAGDVIGYAIHGQRVTLTEPLHDGDRVELLRGLQADPKDARRRRAAAGKKL